MLEITEAAEAEIRRLREEIEVPASSALRISPVSTPGGAMGVGFAFTDGPEQGDQTISEREDFRVYLAPELTEAFDNAALEGSINDDGVELELRTQSDMLAQPHDNHIHDHDGHAPH